MQDEDTPLPSSVRNRLVKAIDPSVLVQRDVSDYDISVNIVTLIAQMFSAYIVQATVKPSQARLIRVSTDKRPPSRYLRP